MRSTFSLVALLILTATSPLVAQTPASPEAVHVAVERGIGFLTKEAVNWIHDKKCASCHHAPMMLWSLGEARDRGFTIDTAAYEEVAKFSLTPFAQPAADPAAPAPATPVAGAPEEKKVSLPIIYLALSSRGAAVDDPLYKSAAAQFSANFKAKLNDENHWDPKFSRPPVFDEPTITTLFAILATESPALRDDADLAPLREKALASLANSKLESNQALNLQLLVNEAQPKPGFDAASVRERLLQQQKEDGSWSQMPEMDGDAYATGQTLYALSHAGIDAQHPAVDRARQFLLSKQQADGSWAMNSRPFGPEGKIAQDLRPIAYYGTAWATLGLLQSIDKKAQ